MDDKEFLVKLHQGLIKWNADDIDLVRKLKKNGYTKYETGMYSGQWKVTRKGLELLNNL